MTRARANKSQQERARLEVLALDALVPRPSNYEIARSVSKRLGRPVAPSTVRYILKKFGKRVDEYPQDRKRSGRPKKLSDRFSRCVLGLFGAFYNPVLVLLTGL